MPNLRDPNFSIYIYSEITLCSVYSFPHSSSASVIELYSHSFTITRYRCKLITCLHLVMSLLLDALLLTFSSLKLSASFSVRQVKQTNFSSRVLKMSIVDQSFSNIETHSYLSSCILKFNPP